MLFFFPMKVCVRLRVFVFTQCGKILSLFVRTVQGHWLLRRLLTSYTNYFWNLMISPFSFPFSFLHTSEKSARSHRAFTLQLPVRQSKHTFQQLWRTSACPFRNPRYPTHHLHSRPERSFPKMHPPPYLYYLISVLCALFLFFFMQETCP